MNNTNNGNDTMQTAAIFNVVSGSDELYKPSYNMPPRSVKPFVTQLVIICQSAVFTRRGQM